MSVAFLSPTAARRMMLCLERSYPEEVGLSKGAALLFDTVYVNVGSPGPLSDLHGAFTDGLSKKHKKRIEGIFRPIEECKPPPKTSTIAKAIKDGALSEDFVKDCLQRLNKNPADNPYTNPDEIDGEVNPLASIEIMLLFGISNFELPARAKKQTAFVTANGGITEDHSIRVAIPEYDKMSWEDILEIRQHKFWEKFKSFLEKEQNPQRMKEKIAKGWESIGAGALLNQDSPLLMMASAVPMGSLPVPNPIAVERDRKAWLRQRKDNSDYPWLHIIAHANNRIKQSQT